MYCADCGGRLEYYEGEHFCADCTRYEVTEAATQALEEALLLRQAEAEMTAADAGPADDELPF